MARVCHFEIHADDPNRAIAFYQTVFGWQFNKWEGPQDYWLIKTGESDQPGIDGGLLRRMGPAPTDGQAVNAFVCTLITKTIDEDVNQATLNGGTVAVPKMAVPGIGWLAYVKDTEGNILGIMQDDPAAA
ncbi:MAG: VOC family protein [Acidobacteria bacterium]|nr:VOC family protein [Acidobacteriota bacterium]